jgi:hypothetical protein
MKKQLTFVLVVLLVCFFSTGLVAEEKEPKPVPIYVADYEVKPESTEEFEAIWKEIVALCKKHDYPLSWEAYQLDGFQYRFVWPMKNYGTMDTWEKIVEELGKKVGKEQWQALMKRYTSTYNSYKSSIYYWMPKRSYYPKTPRLKPAEIKYIKVDLCYIWPGTGKAVADIDKEWVAFYKKNNIAEGFNVYVGDIGTEGPVVVYVTWGKNAVDYHTESAKFHKTYEKEMKILNKKYMPLIRKLESTTEYAHPDLSYQPKKEKMEKKEKKTK